MKFKIGDTVETVGANNPEGASLPENFKKGHRGKVMEYDENDCSFPYKVERKNSESDWFNAKELKLIRKGN